MGLFGILWAFYIRVNTCNLYEYKGKYYRSKMGKGFLPSNDQKPVSKQEAFNSKMVTPDELKKIRSKKRETKEK